MPAAGRKGGVVSPVLVDFIAGLLVVLWSVLLVADFLVPDYTPPLAAHSIIGGVVGSIFGFRLVTATRTKEAEDE